MTYLIAVRHALRNRLAAAFADHLDLTSDQLDEIESIAYNSVQSLKPEVLTKMMRRLISDAGAELAAVRSLASIPFVIAAEMALDIIAARHDRVYGQLCA